MRQCIAVYPEQNNKELYERTKKYIECAAKWGIEEVFTSVHLPELSMDEQIRFLLMVSTLAHQNGLELMVDIGGHFINRALEDRSVLYALKEARIDFLRLDYGYNFEQLKRLYFELELTGFVINASMVNEKDLIKHLECFYMMDENIQIKACHNFYVREESGLDEEFAIQQSKMFEKRNIPVYYCVPCHHHPRGPLHLGLPTIEKHRWQPIELIILNLLCQYKASAVMLADPWFKEEDFKMIQSVLKKNAIEIKVILNKDITVEERKIVLQSHEFRYDSNSVFLRSRSSREMAEYASVIAPKNEKNLRLRGAITIDNANYSRYSGELQVVLKDACEDERVNVVGWIADENEMEKLRYYREGFVYQFIEKKDTAVKE